jgi:hypothetical protein
MDLLAKLPKIMTGSLDDQACKIYSGLMRSRCHCRPYTWYEPPAGVKIICRIKNTLEQKGYKIYEQKKYDLKWVHGQPVRENQRRTYFIGSLGKN